MWRRLDAYTAYGGLFCFDCACLLQQVNAHTVQKQWTQDVGYGKVFWIGRLVPALVAKSGSYWGIFVAPREALDAWLAKPLRRPGRVHCTKFA
jgi:hypothetical protein